MGELKKLEQEGKIKYKRIFEAFFLTKKEYLKLVPTQLAANYNSLLICSKNRTKLRCYMASGNQLITKLDSPSAEVYIISK